MKVIIASQSKLVKERLTGPYGDYETYSIVGGNSYAIKDKLKALGFRWIGKPKAWRIYPKNFNDTIAESLSLMGVDTSIINKQNKVNPIESVKPDDNDKLEVNREESNKLKDSNINQTDTDSPERTRWYKFPVKDNIYQENIVVDFQGEDLELPIRVHRSFIPGKDTYRVSNSRDHVGKPIYFFEVGDATIDNKDELVPFHENPREARNKHSGIFLIKKIAKEKWGEYDEKEFIDNIIKLIKEKIAESGASKIEKELNARNLDPEFKEFLKEYGNKLEVNVYLDFPEEKYNGEYTFGLQIHNYGNRYWLDNASVYLLMDHSFVSDYGKSFDEQIDVSGVVNKEELVNKVKKEIYSNSNLRKEIYEFFKSIPFTEEEFKEAQKESIHLKEMLDNPEGSYYEVLREMRSRGYIRVSKKQRAGQGLQVDEQVKWVVDSDVIKDHIYGNRSKSISPVNDMYSVIAYYIHRRVRGISSWSDAVLTQGIASVYNDLKRLYPDIEYTEVNSAIQKLAELVIEDFFKDRRKSTIDEDWSSFYGGTGGSSGSEDISDIPYNVSESLEKLYLFGKDYDVKIEDVKSSPKGVFRFLSKKLHPDTSVDESEKIEKEEKFKELMSIWDSLPSSIKQSFNYNKWKKFST